MKMASQNFCMQMIKGDTTFQNHPVISKSKVKERLMRYNSEVEQELKNILDYWNTNTVDEINGGFVGKIDHAGHIHSDAPKGSVLNSRILWSFSGAYNVRRNPLY